jgi:hypothetical protein
LHPRLTAWAAFFRGFAAKTLFHLKSADLRFGGQPMTSCSYKFPQL